MESDSDSIYSSSTITTITEYPNRRNILIVGDTGVGKSSLVNLIIGDDRAATSSGTLPCTPHSQEYIVTLDDIEFALHDTVGLRGGNDYLDPIYQAFTLMSRLERSGGISLLVFCMMGGRISITTQQTYNLFVEVLCNRQVPVVIVVTHLGGYDNMEEWWIENEGALKEYGLRSHGHACITATRGYRGIFSDKYEQSREIVRNLLLDYCNRVAWKEEKARWVRRIVMYMRTWLSPNNRNRLDASSDLRRKLVKRCGFSAKDAELLARQFSERLWETSENVLEEEILAGYFKHGDISSCCIQLYPGMTD